MADANHAYNHPQARHVADGLAAADVRFFEEPMPPERIDAYPG